MSSPSAANNPKLRQKRIWPEIQGFRAARYRWGWPGIEVLDRGLMPRPNEKTEVVRHYDFLSPYYQLLWGEHLHHGYWMRGDESREKAQIQLMEHLARLAGIQPGARVLDLGCGIGGSSFFLAKDYGASVTGISISPVQIQMANRAVAERQLDANFLLMDAERLELFKPFDVLWSIESISHYQDPAKFFQHAAKLLKPGGTFAMTDFFRKKELTASAKKKYIQPIENSMFVELHEMQDYAEFLTASGLRVTKREVLNANCAKTWDFPLDILQKKSFWELAAKHGKKFLAYLRAFHAMRAGYSSGNFVYGLVVAKAPLNREQEA